MFEDLVSNLLSDYPGDYLEGLTKDDLNSSLWNGDLKLKNLVLTLACLIDFRELKKMH